MSVHSFVGNGLLASQVNVKFLKRSKNTRRITKNIQVFCSGETTDTLSSLDMLLSSDEDDQAVQQKSAVMEPEQTSNVKNQQGTTEIKQVQKIDQAEASKLYVSLENVCQQFRDAPQVMRYKEAPAIKEVLEQLKLGGVSPKWGSAASLVKRSRLTTNADLKMIGIKDPDNLAKGSIRNEQLLLLGTLVVCSVLAVAESFLPGDWGFFLPYLTGGIVFVVLAIGSTQPALLTSLTDRIGQLSPEFRDRVVGHEAAHFLLGYLLGLPVASYSLELGKQHTEFAEARYGSRLGMIPRFNEEDVDVLSVIAMAGIASEGVAFEQVLGQGADLAELQTIFNQSITKLDARGQQNMTRWAVYCAASLLKRYNKEYEALKSALDSGASVVECIQAIESC